MLVSIQKNQLVMKISVKPINHFLSNKVIETIQKIEKEEEKILCNHCLRTSSNGIRCMGICVADNDYWFKKLKILYQISCKNLNSDWKPWVINRLLIAVNFS